MFTHTNQVKEEEQLEIQPKPPISGCVSKPLIKKQVLRKVQSPFSTNFQARVSSFKQPDSITDPAPFFFSPRPQQNVKLCIIHNTPNVLIHIQAHTGVCAYACVRPHRLGKYFNTMHIHVFFLIFFCFFVATRRTMSTL